MKTYDIHFNDSESSNNNGFSMEKQEAIDYVERVLNMRSSYVSDYAGGYISVVCNETGETVFEKEILP